MLAAAAGSGSISARTRSGVRSPVLGDHLAHLLPADRRDVVAKRGEAAAGGTRTGRGRDRGTRPSRGPGRPSSPRRSSPRAGRSANRSSRRRGRPAGAAAARGSPWSRAGPRPSASRRPPRPARAGPFAPPCPWSGCVPSRRPPGTVWQPSALRPRDPAAFRGRGRRQFAPMSATPTAGPQTAMTSDVLAPRGALRGMLLARRDRQPLARRRSGDPGPRRAGLPRPPFRQPRLRAV